MRQALDVTESRGVLEGAEGLRAAFTMYASPRRSGAPFAVVGTVSIPERGVVAGILAFAENEMFAHLLRRRLLPYAIARYGAVGVRRTEWNADGGNFGVEKWRALVSTADAQLRVSCDRLVITPGTSPDVHAELLGT